MTKSDELDDTMRVLATGTCDTLSGNTRLTYHIGSPPDGEIHLRVYGNTGGGYFSQEWISLRDILTALNRRPDGKPITSILLNPLLRGKSDNTPGFLLGRVWVNTRPSGNKPAAHCWDQIVSTRRLLASICYAQVYRTNKSESMSQLAEVLCSPGNTWDRYSEEHHPFPWDWVIT